MASTAMTAAMTATAAVSAAGELALFFIPTQGQNNANNDGQNHQSDQDGADVRRKPCDHNGSSPFKILR